VRNKSLDPNRSVMRWFEDHIYVQENVTVWTQSVGTDATCLEESLVKRSRSMLIVGLSRWFLWHERDTYRPHYSATRCAWRLRRSCC
jgi:hypothetical protein